MICILTCRNFSYHTLPYHSPCRSFPHMKMARNVYGRITHGAKCLVWDETSMGRIAHAKCPWATVHGAKSPDTLKCRPMCSTILRIINVCMQKPRHSYLLPLLFTCRIRKWCQVFLNLLQCPLVIDLRCIVAAKQSILACRLHVLLDVGQWRHHALLHCVTSQPHQ